MRAVSNTSPISNLAIIGRLEVLKRRYPVVLIPPEVAAELSALSHLAGRSQIESALAQGWLRIEQIATRQPALPFALDPGEIAAIALALAVTADVLLIDEKSGRAAARGLGLAVGGLLGELLHARQQGWVPDLRDEIARLRREAGFFVDLEIERFILAQVGE
jgi:uncharacterized protein